MREVVSNTSPLLYLHQLGSIDLLPALYPHVLVPASVVEELAAGRAAGGRPKRRRSSLGTSRLVA